MSSSLGSPTPLTVSVAALSPGWHHFALSYDGLTYALWVDKARVATATTGGDLRFNSDFVGDARWDGVSIGARGAGDMFGGPDWQPVQSYFSGALSGLRLFDRALTRAEMQDL